MKLSALAKQWNNYEPKSLAYIGHALLSDIIVSRMMINYWLLSRNKRICNALENTGHPINHLPWSSQIQSFSIFPKIMRLWKDKCSVIIANKTSNHFYHLLCHSFAFPTSGRSHSSINFLQLISSTASHFEKLLKNYTNYLGRNLSNLVKYCFFFFASGVRINLQKFFFLIMASREICFLLESLWFLLVILAMRKKRNKTKLRLTSSAYSYLALEHSDRSPERIRLVLIEKFNVLKPDIIIFTCCDGFSVIRATCLSPLSFVSLMTKRN